MNDWKVVSYCKTLPDPIDLRILPNRRSNHWYKFWARKSLDYFVVITDFRVIVSHLDKFVVSAGFTTDLASIPRGLRSIYTVVDKHMAAAVVHDYLYRQPTQIWRGRKFADGLFNRIMIEMGVPALTRIPIYNGVRAFGWLSYQTSVRKKNNGAYA